MAKQQIIILSMLLAVLYGCGNMGNKDKEKQDKFYTITGGWDWIRVPLLKPYEARKIDPKVETNGWGIKLYSNLYQIDKAKKIDIQDNIIFVLSGKTDEKEDFTAIGTYNVPTAWFAIDIRTKTEKGFDSEDEFKQYIQENNYPLPQWHDIDSLSEALAEGGQVPWMPK